MGLCQMISFVILMLLWSVVTVQSSDAPVYVQKGKDVLLDVNNVTEKFRLFVWKFEKNDLVLVTFSPGTNAEISEDYTGRIGFSEKNKYSVILKNLQETDSGIYIGRETGKKDLTLVQLNIIVQVQSSDAPVYVQRGKDVLLDVNNVPETFFLFAWKFYKNDSILISFSPYNAKISEAYKGRIAFSEKNKYSVILKKVKDADSGVYTAQVTTVKGQPTLAQHNIIIQDVVSPVMLKVNSVSNSSDSCNVTLTCSAADSHISSTFRCDDQKCDQDGGNQSKITDSRATLEVYMMNVSVICKHSNRVSSTENTTDIKDVCPQNTGSHSSSISFCLVKIIVFSVGLFLMVSALIGVHLFDKLEKQN